MSTATYDITIDASSGATYDITLEVAAAGAITTGSQLGDGHYIHPTSRKEYYFVGGLYYLITRFLDGPVVQEDVSESGISVPV